MRIRLMSDVEYKLVARTVEHVMQRDGKLHRAEVGREMPSVVFHNVYYSLAQPFTQPAEFGNIKPL